MQLRYAIGGPGTCRSVFCPLCRIVGVPDLCLYRCVCVCVLVCLHLVRSTFNIDIFLLTVDKPKELWSSWQCGWNTLVIARFERHPATTRRYHGTGLGRHHL